MTPAPKSTFGATAQSEAISRTNSPASAGRFILSLCSVAVPIAIPQPRGSQLARFQFFFSHCWEDGRKQYRLQMGYFPTMDEAQKWLGIMIRIYPSAFVTEVPATQQGLLSSTQVLNILEGGGIDRQ
jgi:hypothetical protein